MIRSDAKLANEASKYLIMGIKANAVAKEVLERYQKELAAHAEAVRVKYQGKENYMYTSYGMMKQAIATVQASIDQVSRQGLEQTARLIAEQAKLEKISDTMEFAAAMEQHGVSNSGYGIEGQSTVVYQYARGLARSVGKGGQVPAPYIYPTPNYAPNIYG